jgi:hypothetical protein
MDIVRRGLDACVYEIKASFVCTANHQCPFIVFSHDSFQRLCERNNVKYALMNVVMHRGFFSYVSFIIPLEYSKHTCGRKLSRTIQLATGQWKFRAITPSQVTISCICSCRFRNDFLCTFSALHNAWVSKMLCCPSS